MASKVEQITDVLRQLRSRCPEIIGTSVVSMEGFLIASVSPKEIDEELVSGMSAALLGVGEQISQEIMHAPLSQVFVKSEKGFVILNSVGKDAVLLLLVTGDAKLGLIFLEIRRILPELQKVI
ncbi:MAG: roadblock/LC7 domain-containing protein [Fibrobacterota bacterium]|jgi:predicted regulator of Ras-like GTPase activity (Roadblock/LC7/MglB family)|nr:roadblock/LC7 domain-containing protein [Chitinispirillaceae bacterium]